MFSSPIFQAFLTLTTAAIDAHVKLNNHRSLLVWDIS
jgi:hypothetical protein